MLKRKKKKKKKKKKTSPAIEEETEEKKSPTKKNKKVVRFDHVQVNEFKRCMGLDGVPADGGWPLGLDFEYPVERTFYLDLDIFERQRQLELQKRWAQCIRERRIEIHHYNSKHTHSNHNHNHKDADHQSQSPEWIDADYLTPDHLETRPADFKRRQERNYSSYEDGNIDPQTEAQEIAREGVNLLFRPLREDKRMEILVQAASDQHSDQNDTHQSTDSISQHNSPSKCKKHSHNRKHQHSNDNGVVTRSRSNSCSSSNHHSLEQQQPYYESVEIKHVRNELEQLRFHRSTEHLGCNCKRRKFNRRMNERKLREELRKHGITNTNNSSKKKQTREDLEQMLKKVVDEQGCCYGNDCPCVRNGVNCSADTCSCYQNQTSSSNIGKNPTIEQMKSNCGNRYGLYVVDFDHINKQRTKFTTAKPKLNASQLCQQIGDTS